MTASTLFMHPARWGRFFHSWCRPFAHSCWLATGGFSFCILWPRMTQTCFRGWGLNKCWAKEACDGVLLQKLCRRSHSIVHIDQNRSKNALQWSYPGIHAWKCLPPSSPAPWLWPPYDHGRSNPRSWLIPPISKVFTLMFLGECLSCSTAPRTKYVRMFLLLPWEVDHVMNISQHRMHDHISDLKPADLSIFLSVCDDNCLTVCEI